VTLNDGVIVSVNQFVDYVFEQIDLWHQARPADESAGIRPWYRGERVSEKPLLPKLYRKGPPYNENDLLQHFRRLATVPGWHAGIDRDSTDLWLYLARHAGLPTRLLDWTEGALIAMYFAVADEAPARVWMLVPQALNFASHIPGFELPWHSPTITNKCIRAAWELDSVDGQPDLPIAIHPMHVHPRLQVQRSVFTIHGKRKESIDTLMREIGLAPHFLRSFDIDPSRHREILYQLDVLGISHGTLFPDIDGLAKDLTAQFWGPDPLMTV
jgi:hypothetical protein